MSSAQFWGKKRVTVTFSCCGHRYIASLFQGHSDSDKSPPAQFSVSNILTYITSTLRKNKYTVCRNISFYNLLLYYNFVLLLLLMKAINKGGNKTDIVFMVICLVFIMYLLHIILSANETYTALTFIAAAFKQSVLISCSRSGKEFLFSLLAVIRL